MLDVTRDSDGIATLVWNMQDRPMNVLSPEARVRFIALVDELIADPTVRGVVMTSAREEFIAGADLTFLTRLRGADPAQAMETMRPMRAALRRLERSGKPVVAAINGTALGGGLEVCLACSHRIAADRPDALLGLPEVNLGLLPGAGGTQRLARMIGVQKALDLMLKGQTLSPRAAHEAGFVEALAAPGDLMAAARNWILAQPAEVLRPWDRPGFALPGPAADSPELHRWFVTTGARIQAETRDLLPAPRAILSAVFEGIRVPMDAALDIEFRHFIGLLTGDVAQNIIRTQFFGMNEVRKLAARPKAPARFVPARLGILGAGLMGTGLAEVAALRGLDVVMTDRSPDAAAAGRARIAASLDTQVAKGRLAAPAAAEALARVVAGTGPADLAGVDAVIEAVFEDRATKAEVTRATLAATGPDVLFASNTSKIAISGLATASPRPDRFIGMHFFSPVPRMALLEIIRGTDTSDETLAQAMDLGKRLGKLPIVVNDAPGFYTSRCVGAYLNEGLILLAAGVPAVVIENAARAAGMPVGPLSLADEIGLDLMLQVRHQEQADLDRPPGAEFATIRRMVEDLGRKGRKGGGGFYDYPQGGDKRLWPDLARHFAPRGTWDAADIGRRLLFAQGLEAARCFDQGVIAQPRDADVGSVLGWGFPKHTGGVISLVDTVGAAGFAATCDAWAAADPANGARYAVPALLRRMAEGGQSFHPAAEGVAAARG